jgi:glycosyltransferase involved in cell wall biosynthesis
VHNASQTWSVIILCYNELGTIRQVATEVKAVMEEMAPGRHEIIIVDDGSDDGSAQTIRDIQNTVPCIKTVFHPSNLGIGHALRMDIVRRKTRTSAQFPVMASSMLGNCCHLGEYPIEPSFRSIVLKT